MWILNSYDDLLSAYLKGFSVSWYQKELFFVQKEFYFKCFFICQVVKILLEGSDYSTILINSSLRAAIFAQWTGPGDDSH